MPAAPWLLGCQQLPGLLLRCCCFPDSYLHCKHCPDQLTCGDSNKDSRVAAHTRLWFGCAWVGWPFTSSHSAQQGSLPTLLIVASAALAQHAAINPHPKSKLMEHSPRHLPPPPAVPPPARSRSGRQSAQLAARAAGLHGEGRGGLGALDAALQQALQQASRQRSGKPRRAGNAGIAGFSPSRKVSLGASGVRIMPSRRSARPLQEGGALFR